MMVASHLAGLDKTATMLSCQFGLDTKDTELKRKSLPNYKHEKSILKVTYKF
jgi:hypothetical protein